jgi:hypothetical protein
MRLFDFAVAVSILGLATTACSSIRVVKKMPDGGIVALQGDQGGARQKAEDYMHGQCPGGYDVVEEGEAVVGQESTARTSKTIIGPVTSGTSQDVREWRITYKCKGAAQASTQTVYVAF